MYLYTLCNKLFIVSWLFWSASSNSSNRLNRNSRNVVHVVYNNIMCRYTFSQKIHVAVIFLDFVPFEIKSSDNIK